MKECREFTHNWSSLLWRPGLQNIKAWLDNPPKVLQFIMKTPITAKKLNANLQKSFLILLKLTRIIIREAPKKWCVNISLYFIVSFSRHYYYYFFFSWKKFNNNEKVVVVSRKNIYELVFVRRRRRSIRELIYKDKDK